LERGTQLTGACALDNPATLNGGKGQLFCEWAYAKAYRTETERRETYPIRLHT
jgi:hypothetical protein